MYHLPAQLCVLQFWLSLELPEHVAPPAAGDGLLHDLDRPWLPVPHDCVQESHELHDPQPPFTTT